MANHITAQGWIQPAGVESARRHLAALFVRVDETLEARHNMQRALAIRQAYPELAEEHFRVPVLVDDILEPDDGVGATRSFFTLCHFFNYKESTSTRLEMCILCPNALKVAGNDGDNAIRSTHPSRLRAALGQILDYCHMSISTWLLQQLSIGSCPEFIDQHMCFGSVIDHSAFAKVLQSLERQA